MTWIGRRVEKGKKEKRPDHGFHSVSMVGLTGSPYEEKSWFLYGLYLWWGTQPLHLFQSSLSSPFGCSTPSHPQLSIGLVGWLDPTQFGIFTKTWLRPKFSLGYKVKKKNVFNHDLKVLMRCGALALIWFRSWSSNEMPLISTCMILSHFSKAQNPKLSWGLSFHWVLVLCSTWVNWVDWLKISFWKFDWCSRLKLFVFGLGIWRQNCYHELTWDPPTLMSGKCGPPFLIQSNL